MNFLESSYSNVKMADRDIKFIEDYEQFWKQKQKGELKLTILTKWTGDSGNRIIFADKLQMNADKFTKNKRVLWSLLTTAYIKALNTHNLFYEKDKPYIWDEK